MSQNSDYYRNYDWHKPVMLEKVIEYLKPRNGGIYVDCTAGGGGHAEEILNQSSPDGKLIAIDKDPEALKKISERLSKYKNRLITAKANFAHLANVLEKKGIYEVDGILMDLGVSSYQLDNPERGFSYMQEAPLDMRMDPSQEETAAHLLNRASKRELAEIIKKYGEEKWATRIADFIVNARQNKRIETTGQLVEIIKAAIPAGARRKGPHPAKRTFQALRIAINSELENLEKALEDGIKVLSPNGRICVISFHSLEDKMVKEVFREHESPCKCPPKLPQCVCGMEPVLKQITRRPVTPDNDELEFNTRARSAKLRIAEKI